MLRTRLITVLTFNNGVLFRSKLFVPDYRYTLNFVDAWSVDEIVILDITRPDCGERQNFNNIVKKFASRCFVPLSVGGGIRTMEDAQEVLSLGADKVVLNTGAFEDPKLISQISERYGSQCVVLSIDAKTTDDGGYEVYTRFGGHPTGVDPDVWAKQGQELGAGEIMITSIDRDGSLSGYDLNLCKKISEAIDVPVLICGGAGNWQHFVEGVERGGASAVCTSNIYHFTDNAIKNAKSYMDKAGIAVRL